MKWVTRALFVIAVIQVLSTLAGAVTLIIIPQSYTEALANTAFEGQYVLAAILLGIVVGGFQWAAAVIHVKRPTWRAFAHWLAGLVMLGWIAGECLVMNSFLVPHAVWGGLGALQVALVAVLLGVCKPLMATTPGCALR